jgi:hypothetical protein
MTIIQILTFLLSRLVVGILQIPVALLNVIGLFMPSCSESGITGLPVEVLDNMVQLTRWISPIWSALPVSQLWVMLSLTITYFVIRWFARPAIKVVMGGIPHFWWIIVVVWVISASLNLFLGNSWQDSEIWTEWFGQSATSTFNGYYSGGGGGGGGGGSW